MKKVVFCEIAWMEFYDGGENDTPRRGGKYIEDNGTGGEIFNFLPINHYCYGYVMHQGYELHIERYENIAENHSEVGDMTVVWVANDGEKSVIVGWYENATMYREPQLRPDLDKVGLIRDYHFKAFEDDCFLIPVEERDFVIPRAAKAGPGRGMGQSQVWYADSDTAQEEIVPLVLEYLSKKRKEMEPDPTKIPEPEKIEFGDRPLDEYIDRAEELFNKGEIIEAMDIAKQVAAKDESFRIRKLMGDFYRSFVFFDEAIECYEKCLSYQEDPMVLSSIMYCAQMAMFYDKATEYANRLIAVHSQLDKEFWENDALAIMDMFMFLHDYENATKLLIKLENERDKYDYGFIEDAWKAIKIAQGGEE